jgi:hypothetical protein
MKHTRHLTVTINFIPLLLKPIQKNLVFAGWRHTEETSLLVTAVTDWIHNKEGFAESSGV